MLEILSSALRQEKEIESISLGKEEVKLFLLVHDKILYLKDPVESNRILLDLINPFRLQKPIYKKEKKIWEMERGLSSY